jgi:hypothetical protein
VEELLLKFLASLGVILSLSACASATPIPTPDSQATETKIAANIFATQTASAPTATSTLTNTPTPLPTNTATITLTPLPTDTPTLTPTPLPTNTPRPLPTATPKPAPVTQDQLVHLTNAWDVTLISVRRDKAVFFYDNGETAFGVYASFLFRARNLQSGSDHIGRTLDFNVRVDGGSPIYHKLFNTYEYKARWFYSCCVDPFANLAPGEENVVLIAFDVPEAAKNLDFNFTPSNPFERAVPVIGPDFFVPNFDQIPPRKSK